MQYIKQDTLYEVVNKLEIFRMEKGDQMESLDSQYALKLAYLTMKERCKQLQTRLGKVEEENALMKRMQHEKNILPALNIDHEEDNASLSQQKQMEELRKQNTQLTYHIYMVSLENRQLWKRLTKIYQNDNKFSNQSTKASESTKFHPVPERPPPLTYSLREIPGFKDRNEKLSHLGDADNDQSLEEIVLIDEKTDLKQLDQDTDGLQTHSESNLKKFGFTYPDDFLMNTDSLEQLKDHDVRLTQVKRALLLQQHNLRNTLNNLKKMKKNQTCNNCKNNITKLMCQAGTQFDSDCSLKENEETQTSLPSSSLIHDKKSQSTEEDNICPLCGVVYKNSISFSSFHEHVVNHFTNEISDDFEIIT